MDAGKDLEDQLVWRLYHDRKLLSPPPRAAQQMHLEISSHWLTGAPDAVTLPEGWNRPLPIEIKGKDHEAILRMQRGEQSYDAAHKYQLDCYMGMLNTLHYQLYPLLSPTQDGVLLYVSRGRPSETFEFNFHFDSGIWRRGLQMLERQQKWFIEDVLPLRPRVWKWTEPPCKWCELKKVCKADMRKDVRKLSESTLIEASKKIKPSYDYGQARREVLARWQPQAVAATT
jgi:hypothetical protein